MAQQLNGTAAAAASSSSKGKPSRNALKRQKRRENKKAADKQGEVPKEYARVLEYEPSAAAAEPEVSAPSLRLLALSKKADIADGRALSSTSSRL